MELHNIVEAFTKAGQEITFERIEDSEGDKNRGWQVDQIEAFIDGKNVGYLKISYIPHERFEKYYPTIFNFLGQIRGHSCLPYKKRDKDYHTLSRDELIEYWPHAWITIHRYWPEHTWKEGYLLPNGQLVKNLDRPQLIAEWEKLEREAQKVFGKQFKEFFQYHVDKPLVDFIRVENEYQRQRIGEALYKEGAKWMAEKGLKLHASTLQTKEAAGVWRHMEKGGIVDKSNKRRYLKYG